jgi:SWI/SNF-related matrix-associated actin-dependent regulator 1 of chromatin subfamily A
MEDDTEKWDPSKSPDAKWLIHPDAVRQKDTAYVTLDIGYFKDNVTPAWVVTCSHYSGQLRDFSNFTNGSVAGSLYHFPVTEYAAETLIKYFHARPTLEALKLVPHICPDVFGKKLGASISASIFKQIESTSILADLPIPLFPFQVEGILKMTYYKGRALLADEMGLGKTIQSLGFWLYNKIGKTLIICPRSVKLNWQSEIFQWLRNIRQEDVVIIDTLMKTLPEDKIFYVINYDIIDKWRNELKSLQFELLLVDEAHYIKSSKANRTKAVLDVAAGIGYVLALTGTPVINRGIEIFNLFTLLAPGVFPKRGKFVSAFTNDRKNILNGPGNAEDIERTVKETADSNFSGITNRELLGDVLRETILIRRTKKEVLPDLPEKIRTMIPIECDDKHYKMYKQSEEEFKIMLSECGMSIGDFLKGLTLKNPTDQIRALAALEKARQAAAAAKLNMAIEWINNTFENIDKLVIFAHHKFVIDRLVAEFPNMSVFITGEVVEKDRQSAIDNFYKNDQIKLMIVSIMAGGVGINFTVASNVVFLETGWSPAINDQAEDRVHRIGQTGVVNIYLSFRKIFLDF